MTATWSSNKTWATGEIVTAAQLNQYLRDNLDWLKGRPYGTEQDFDGTIFNTTSSNFQDTGITSGSVTTTGGRVLVLCWGTVLLPTTSAVFAYMTLYEDGANAGDAVYGMVNTGVYTSAFASTIPFSMAYITPTAPTAAAHEWKLYLRNSNNTNAVTLQTVSIAAFEIGV